MLHHDGERHPPADEPRHERRGPQRPVQRQRAHQQVRGDVEQRRFVARWWADQVLHVSLNGKPGVVHTARPHHGGVFMTRSRNLGMARTRSPSTLVACATSKPSPGSSKMTAPNCSGTLEP